jgi:hypothetical protein
VALSAGLPKGFIFKQKIPNLGKFCMVLQWKMLVYFVAVWYFLRPFGTFYSHCHLVYFSRFGSVVLRKIWQP